MRISELRSPAEHGARPQATVSRLTPLLDVHHGAGQTRFVIDSTSFEVPIDVLNSIVWVANAGDALLVVRDDLS